MILKPACSKALSLAGRHSLGSIPGSRMVRVGLSLLLAGLWSTPKAMGGVETAVLLAVVSSKHTRNAAVVPKTRAHRHTRHKAVRRRTAYTQKTVLAPWPQDSSLPVAQFENKMDPELARLLEAGPEAIDSLEPEPEPSAWPPSCAQDAACDRLRTASTPFLGRPYRTGGDGNPGFDCSGFVRRILSAFGVSLEGRSSPEYYAQGDKVDDADLRSGDLVFFSDHHRKIGHVGVYLGNGEFVHASVRRGVIVSKLEEKYYSKRFKGARRLTSIQQALASSAPPQP